ncbi:MAG TPA: serine/threonine-protein kinase [Bryobacteraceae bacterium]|jgi:serine/threonine-protein kinase|nr:serine/threonine-protein kinase [Bryobacteraceae bacterium]
MDRARWQQIQDLFHAAADLPQTAQRSFLQSTCGEDEGLLLEVLAMLDQDASGESLLDRSLAEAARNALQQPASLLPRAFGPYRVLTLLGEGGMGVVYLAEREDLAIRVAIKVLRDAWLSPARRERFAAEQRTLAQLNHPSIAHLYDAATLDDGTPYFVMEYVDGIPLIQFCRQNSCSIGMRLQLFRAVCEAVQHAHSHAVIHRDLKPSNILVKSDGAVRLLDFGIAKQLETLHLQADQTMAGLRLMTPAYAAPEQIRGDRVGIGTDVYSLGVILYELLAGRLPFDLSNLNAAEAATAIAEHEPVKPSLAAPRDSDSEAQSNTSSLSKAAWAELDVLCLTAMHKDPQRRYRSVEALIRDIDHYLNGEPLDAQPDTLRYRTGKFVRRNREAVIAACTVFAAVAGLVVFFTMRLAAERDNANRQTAIATAVNRFLADDLLGRGNPFQSGRSTETLVNAIQQVSPVIDRKFSNEPQVAARLHLTIARALDNRSNFPDARNEYLRARDLFLQTQGPLSQDAISVELQRAAMEARSFQSAGIPAAKSLIAGQEILLRKIQRPGKELTVWLLTAKGMVALVESDAQRANQDFKAASETAATLPQFDELAKSTLKQRLAFTYIRLGDGATAERLARELIAAYSNTTGPDSPYVLRVRLNLAQAFMIQRKFAESIQEANAIYPDFLSRFGADHELTMQLLATRAQSEGSMSRFDDSVRDDLAIYNIAVKKQGPLSFYAIGTLSDASEAQCRAHHLIEGLLNARNANDASIRAFGPHAALTQGTMLPVADCLIGLGRLEEASTLLDGIDAKAVAQLTGDPNWGAGVTLAQAEIALRDGDYPKAQTAIASVRPVFSRPDAEPYQRHKMDELSQLIRKRLLPK